MGRKKKERATKSRPKANPLLPVNLKCWWPLLAEVGGVESGVPVAPVFVQMVGWKSRQKRATNGCEAGQREAVKSKANKPLAPAVVLVVGGEVCSGQRFFAQMARVAKSSDAFQSAQKRAQWVRGCQKAKAYPLLQPPLARC